jgi:AraC family transcriptional regulator, alkane utilization regulator
MTVRPPHGVGFGSTGSKRKTFAVNASPLKFPNSAARQARASGRHDALAETLRAIRLSDSVFMSARFSKPFGIVSPARFDAGTPLAHLRHVSVLHLIVSGSCTLQTESGERHALSAGDVVLLPFAAAHRFWNGDCPEMVHAPDLMRSGRPEGFWTLDHGGGGEITRMICGFIESRDLRYAPVFRSLPPLVIDRTGDDRLSGLVTSAVRDLVQVTDAATPSTELMLGRLMELLFVEVVRRNVEREAKGASGCLAALNDPIVGRALHAIHGDPARRWTVEELAREAGASRSVLSERFRAVVGQPPIEYLAARRIRQAAERLRNTADCVAAIAADVGYESQAAFNRAFKRIAGMAPGRWREAEAALRGTVRPGLAR